MTEIGFATAIFTMFGIAHLILMIALLISAVNK